MDKMCYVCGDNNIEVHHIIKRSQAKFLKDCKYNLVCLCPEHHRGTNSPHGKNNKEIDKKLKLMLQNKLEMLFLKEEFTKEEIKEILEINENAVNSLCKLIQSKKGKYTRDDIIRTVMGGKIV